MAVGAESKVAVNIFVGILVLALVMITAGLFALNVEGAWIASGGNLPYTTVIGGVELLAAVALTLAVRRRGLQRYVGMMIFAASVWICIQNGKFSIHHHFATMFPDRPDVLEAKADLLLEQADLIREDPAAARTGLQQQLERKITDKVRAESEVTLMTDATRIRGAQERLQALGLYEGRIDGIKDLLTEDATRKRGADLNREINQLDAEIRELEKLTQSAASEGGILGLKMEAAALKGQAKTAREGTTWMNRLLWGTESARSFGFWAYFTGALAAVMSGSGSAPRAPGPTLASRISAAWRRVFSFGRSNEGGKMNTPAEAPVPPAAPGDEQTTELSDGTTATVSVVNMAAPPAPPDPRAGWSPQQVAGSKGGEAGAHGREAGDRLKLRIPPVLTIDGADTGPGPRLFVGNEAGELEDRGLLYGEDEA